MTDAPLSARECEVQFSNSRDRFRRQPAVTANAGKPPSALLEGHERLVAPDQRPFRAQDLTDKDLSEIAAAHMQDGLDHLDTELDK